LSQVDSRNKNFVEAFVDIVFLFKIDFILNSSVGVEEIVVMQFGVEKNNDFQKLLGGNHILNIEVCR